MLWYPLEKTKFISSCPVDIERDLSLPILVTVIRLGLGSWALLLGAARGPAGSPTHDIVA